MDRQNKEEALLKLRKKLFLKAYKKGVKFNLRRCMLLVSEAIKCGQQQITYFFEENTIPYVKTEFCNRMRERGFLVNAVRPDNPSGVFVSWKTTI